MLPAVESTDCSTDEVLTSDDEVLTSELEVSLSEPSTACRLELTDVRALMMSPACP